MSRILYPLGLLIATVAFGLAVRALHQSFSSYYDFVAAVMVFGGTLAVATITLPWEHSRDILRGFSDLMWPKTRDHRSTITTGLTLVGNPASNPGFANSLPNGLPKQILEDGAELISLGFAADKIQSILKERVYQSGKRLRRVANSVRALGKYPPAFGLMGTVLGLVNLMRGIAAGLDAKQTGVEMAVALVATFYGLIVANLLITPAGEAILRRAQEEEDDAELALQAVLLAAENSSLLEAQELLNSFVPPERQVNIISSEVGAA